jgi:hypothetical protein
MVYKMRMQPADIFHYTSFVTFLKDYYAFKRSVNPHFNYTVWSKKLYLDNVASLTRILSGERFPGTKILDALCAYFKFSDKERECFLTLVRLEKETNSEVRALYQRQLVELRAEATRAPKPLITVNAQMCLLWGTAEPVKFNEYLGRYGFESILSYGVTHSAFCLKGAFTYESELGPYPEFHLACYTKRKGAPLGEFELFCDKIYSSNQEVVRTWQKWGSPYSYCSMEHKLENGSFPLSFQLGEGERPLLSFSLGASDKPLSQASQPNHTYGYNSLRGSTHGFKMLMNSTAYFRDFDPKVDHCQWRSDSEVGKFLDEIEFRPNYWTFHPDFRAVIYPAEKR